MFKECMNTSLLRSSLLLYCSSFLASTYTANSTEAFFSFAQLSILFSVFRDINVVIAESVQKKNDLLTWNKYLAVCLAKLHLITRKYFYLLLMTISLCYLLRMLFLNLNRSFFFYHLIFVFLKSIAGLHSHDNFHEVP